MKEKYREDGYIVIQTGLSSAVLNEARGAHGPLQPREYHYNPEGHRFFEAWKSSQAVRDIAWCPAVLAAIREVCDLDADPRPLQTINFDRGSNQPLHQDGIHFQTFPFLGHMVGVWVALEDMDLDNGPLCYVPGSHRLGFKGWQDLGMAKCEVGKQFGAYREYEAWAEQKVHGEKVPFVCKRGDAFIWGLDLLHGGWPVRDPKRTRYSQVTHYAFPDAEKGWAPMFSDAPAGDYYWKSMRWFDATGKRHEWEAR